MLVTLRISLAVRAAFIIALAFTLACSSTPPVRASRDDCEKLQEHLVEVRMSTVAVDHEMHRAAIRAALHGFVETCTESTTRDELRCALVAHDFKTVSACAVGGAS